MAQPITWRSLFQDGGQARASLILNQSQDAFTSGFDALNRVLANRQAFDQQQANDVQEGLKQSYLDQLAGAKTPEELAAIQQSGALSALQSRLTAANRGAVRGADEARLAGIRQNITQEQAFTDNQAIREEKPLVDLVQGLISRGEFDAAKQVLGTRDMRNEAPLYQALQTGERNKVIQGRDDTTWVQKQEDRKGQVERDNLALTGLRRQEELQKQAAADLAEQRKLEEVLAREQASHATYMTQVGKDQGELAKTLSLPRNADGSPNFLAMNAKQRQMFDEEAQVIGLPSSSAVVQGDTARGADFYNRLATSGAFSPRMLASFKDRITGAYNSTAPTLQGNDAYNVAVATAQNQVGFERDDSTNIYAPGSTDARKAYSDLSTQIPDIVKSAPNGYDQDEDVPAVQSLVGKWAVEGVKIPKGTKYDDGTVLEKDLYITPSVADVMRFVRGAEPGIGGWFRDRSRAETIEKDMETWLRSSSALELVKRGLESQQYRDGQRVKQLILDSRNPPKK